MSFSQLGLSAELLRAVETQGYAEPTPIQAQAIPVILEGKDVLASAQTGTGKTAGFTLPLLQRLQENPRDGKRRRVRALVLTPTRELAAQISESIRDYGRNLPLTAVTIYGGVNINPQFDRLRKGADIVVATPGRLLDHMGQGSIDLSSIEILVLDEADRMLDMGFIRDIRRILEKLPKQRQNLLFSATFSDEIRALANGMLHSPVRVQVAEENRAADNISQIVWHVGQTRKRELLSHRIGSGNWQQVLVFTRTKRGADRLAKALVQDGLTAAAIHGNKSQNARTRALADFKSRNVRVLVATDVAARGLDIDRLPYVVNYDLPQVPEDYVHRIGRTARAGQAGHAISLVAPDETKLLTAIERLLKRRVDVEDVPGYQTDVPGAGQREPRPARSGSPGRAGSAGRSGRTGRSGNGAGSARAGRSGNAARSGNPGAAGNQGRSGNADRSGSSAQAARPDGSGTGGQTPGANAQARSGGSHGRGGNGQSRSGDGSGQQRRPQPAGGRAAPRRRKRQRRQQAG